MCAEEQAKRGFETVQLHAGQDPDAATGARVTPIYQTTSYCFRDTDHAAALFALEEPGYIYTRIMNPTTDVLEQRVAALEGGVGALAFASGMAAITGGILNICYAGSEIVAAATLYGGTVTLLSHTLPHYGVRTVFVDPSDPESFRAAITEKTRLVLIETLGNPEINVPDLAAIAAIAHEAGVPLMVDNTFATPYLCRPIEHGADIVVHSLTKFMGGHGTSIGGILVDSGTFPWAEQADKFPMLCEPDASYHGLVYTEAVAELAYIIKARTNILRDVGGCMSPFNAFLLLQGIETLSLRMERHCANAQAIAEWLEEHPCVSWVKYPGLPSHPSHALARRYLPRGCGSIMGFGVKGGKEAGRKLIESVKLCSHLANVGDAKTLIIHPPTTTHQQLTDEQQRAAGITPDFVRLSVGIETVEDIMADLDQALRA